MTLKTNNTMHYQTEAHISSFEIFAISVLVIMALTAAFLAFTVLL
jgi:hypothetical protein